MPSPTPSTTMQSSFKNGSNSSSSSIASSHDGGFLSRLFRQNQLLFLFICAMSSLIMGSLMLASVSQEMTLYNLSSGSSSSSNLGFIAGNSAVHPQASYAYKVKPMTVSKMTELRGPNGPKYNVLVTGAAGFVGMHTSLELQRIGMTPIGYDNVNSYYSTKLKEARIAELGQHSIPFVRGDVCDRDMLKKTIQEHKITRIIHLAAQAGVRYSLDHPLEYTRNNIDCFVHLLETIHELGLDDQTLVYASSSSVYGNNLKIPFQETDPVQDPASLYAATKRSNELMAHTYWNLYNLTSIGLRFFTVYGPYGRPDMAPWIFTQKISQNTTIQVFNHGNSQRDFTYVDDIVQGVVNSLLCQSTNFPEVINLGNGRPIVLREFVALVEQNVGWTAKKRQVGMQKGDVPVTYADITKAQYLLGYQPSTPIETGIRNFVVWFQQHNAAKEYTT